MTEFSAKRMIGICGACVAYYIGAGFATMQEVVQYRIHGMLEIFLLKEYVSIFQITSQITS